MSRFTLLIFTLLLNLAAMAQHEEPGSSFDFNLLNRDIQIGLNKFRMENDLDSLEINPVLDSAAALSAQNMAEAEKADAYLLRASTPKNLKNAGGSGKGEEIIIVTPLGKGKTPVTPAEVAQTILTKWAGSKKEKDIILNTANAYVGIRCGTDGGQKRVYVSVMLGNYRSMNDGAKHKAELKVPFNTKSKKLKDADPKKCRNCEKWKDYVALHDGLRVEEDGKIYLEYNNLKNLGRLLKKPGDALAVDIVQKDQFTKADYAIEDNRLRNRGVMLKPLKKDKLFAKNLIKPENPKKKVNKLRVEMGTFPKAISGEYELNLLVIQDGYVCRTVLRSYMEYTDQEPTPVEMLPMPESAGSIKPPFEPRSESALLNFTIPFAKNKSEFRKEDVQPFIDALQEPDFIIEGLFIYAYSSIEGDSVANAKLQRKRAESVVKVLQQMQQSTISPSVITNDSWDLFRLEMEDGKYDYLTKMSKQEAVGKINHTKGLAEELEPSLAKERFAQIVLDVTYDISGSKEEKFSVVQFNRAVKSGNTRQAYRIMDYIAKKKMEKKYTAASFEKMEIPKEAKNSGLLMNKVYYEYLANGKVVNEDEFRAAEEIHTLDPSNPTIRYNYLFCKIQHDTSTGDKTAQADMQLKIDELYKSGLPKKLVDGLNIEWQFKLLDELDTPEGTEQRRQDCIDKIKSFYNFREGTWQNAVKLAYAFARAKDFAFACNILDPYVEKEIQSTAQREEKNKILTAYISIASHVPERFYTHRFSAAVAQSEICKLVGAPHLSFQVLENPDIHKAYRSAGCSGK